MYNARDLFQLLAVALLCGTSSAQVYNLSLSIEEGLPARTIVGDIRAGLPEHIHSSGFFISESRDSDVFRDLEIDGDTGIISTAVVLDRESRDEYEFAAATLTGEVVKVSIVVRDVNDHSPVFSTQILKLNVSELSPPGTRFELEGARDQDEGDFGTQGYRITDRSLEELFKLEFHNTADGVLNLDLILLERLDRETVDSYSLAIEAFDGGIPSKTGRLQLHITVTDENDNLPVFNQTEYRAVLRENAPLRTAVCQVYASDLDTGDNGLVTYEINRRQSDPNEFFIIDKNTGVIYVNKPLDYESQSFFELILTAWDNGVQPESSSAFVGIRVLDVNDNSPAISVLFLSGAGEPEVSEGASYGEYVARVSITDPDLGEVNRVNVSLRGGDGKFTLKPTDDFLFALCVDGMLDREERDLYELTVVASDFGSPPLASESTFLIKVTDMNDNAPVFENDSYVVKIPEDVSLGSAVVQVKATDKDEGMNSDLRYSILKSDQSHLVHIDPETGFISMVALLDHERCAEVGLLVMAVDGGSPPLSSTATVSIQIEDINDNRPEFQQHLYSIIIPEHTAIGTCFLQVTAVDADSSDSGTVEYSLSDELHGQDAHPLFHVNSVSGEICVSQDIDHDLGLVNFDLSVKAVDPGGLSSQTYIHIEVEDLNDNAPIFNPEKYATSISSHTQAGTEILSVIATDQDSGSNGQITYQLLPGDSSSLFSVDKSTGAVYLTSPLTQLGVASVKLSITAEDGGGRAAAHPAQLTLHILHSAQAPALFQKSHYAFSVSEDAPVGTTVGTVHAINPANSVESISYRISSGDPQGLFTVNSQSGVISTSRPLDHESLPYALLTLQSLTGTLPIYSTAQVNITVTDVNDNTPVFPRASDDITVSQRTPPSTLLFIAHAHDRDSALNGKIHYSLRPASEFFAIDPHLGSLTLSRSLALDLQPRHVLEVVAEDEGSPSLSSIFSLTVHIDPSVAASDDMLAFETLVYQVEIGENTQRDTRVIQVRAHGGRSHRGASVDQTHSSLSYTLEPLSAPPPFIIHPDNGWMFLSDSLDYETEPQYRFRVRAIARDDGSEVIATATVVVLVLDENDNAPVFSRDIYFFTVQEGPSPQGLVGTVKATDRDSQQNSQLSYILLSDGKHFRINSKTGEVTNWVALDREERAQHTLRVMVTDQGRPRLNATATVHILVTDINDNPPCFTHLPAGRELNMQVSAGLPAGSVVTSMFAKDPDAGDNGTVTFSLIAENGLGHFDIDSRSGDIKTTARFSPNYQTHYTLKVVARDNGPIPLEESAIVHLQVQTEKNKNGVQDFHGLRQFRVREDVKLGTVIGSLGLAGPHREQLHYSIAEGDGSFHFGVDGVSGDLFVAQQLDYEARQHYFLVIRAEGPPTVNATALVAVRVEDVNDHAPWFPGEDSVVVFGLSEDIAVGTIVCAFKARDGDGSLRNSALRYSLTTDAGPSIGQLPFHINPHIGVVTTTEPLDREQSQSFVFTVTVSDQVKKGGDQRLASVTTQVFLLDVNDNSPAFVSADTAHVLEDAELGCLVHHLIAEDKDEGRNKQVTYRLLSGNEDGLFTLEEKTGLLFLAGSLDYESQNTHTLTVEASDNGLPSLSSTQSLSVVVLDVNDQAPVFQHSVFHTSVMENREPGEPLLRVTATDMDSDENAALTYTLLPGPGYDFFTIDSHTGQISTSIQLDRELHPAFTLRVQAQDSGVQSLSSTTTVLCSVLDDNDNTPDFSQPTVHILIPENLPPGVIYTAQAADPDSGPNGLIMYSIEDVADSFFIINATSGAISTTRILDREQSANYTLTISASDRGPTPLSSTMRLHIALSDENDNSPVFARKSYRASVSEGLPAGAEILCLVARDPDDGPNGEVTYSLAEDTSGAFQVDAVTGVVALTRRLDRESRSQHTFRVTATDGCSQGPRSSVAMVTVQVEDINDNPPTCAEDLVRVSVTATARPGRPVATVKATDPDQGENGTVVFSLVEEDEVFDIARSSGEIHLKAQLNDSTSGTKLLRVRAADQGVPALSSSCLVLIQLDGQNQALQFTEALYEVAIPENSRAGSWVANVAAHDQTPDGRIITYSIFNGNENGAFSINSLTGDITVREQSYLDFEEQRKIHLVVLAERGDQTAHTRVAITLLDVNDNAPVFKQSHYRTAVWEGQIHNTYVMQVFATDSDSGVNGQIDYSIVSGNHNSAFIIDSVRGILATNAVLDREIISSYKLVIQAKDRGSPPLSGSSTVRVEVVDVNDNSPAIPPMEPVVVAENLPVGYFVTQVTANDVDLNAVVTYSFSGMGETNGSFTIDHYSGVITLTRGLDHEEEDWYMLKVEASDSVHQTEADLCIQVLDVNDNAPVFTEESYQVVLSELTSIDTFVVAVLATDKDSGLNGKISYRLLSSPMRGFYIDAENGSLFTNKPMKHVASGNTIRLQVEARDSGDPVLSSVTSVDIQVVDANDHAPCFQHSTYQVSVAEDVPVGSTLLTLTAEDQDYSEMNTHLDYAITGGNKEKSFCVEAAVVQKDAHLRTVGRIVLCNSLDRELTEMYLLTVTVTDRGEPPLNSSTELYIRVLDVNDNVPTFGASEYHIQVSEFSPVGTSLIQVSAHDLDQGANGIVRYDIISGNNKGHLRLDYQTGLLEVNGTLDYEEDMKYTLTIQASDGGGPGNRRVGFAVVFVSVLDENDNSPIFMFSTFHCSVRENQPAFTQACSVHAVDQDAGAYGILTYSILSSCFMDYVSGNPDRRDAFIIDHVTGDIHTRQTFDYERESEYCFVVEARDKGDQVATVRVQINIEGVDEFSPIFTQKQYHFSLPLNARIGESVGLVMALDYDGGHDGVIMYSLVEASPFFSINKTTGSIFVSDRVYRRRGSMTNDGIEELIVLASSPKLDSRSTTCHVFVNISSSAEALRGVALNVQTVSLCTTLIIFLLLLISFIALVLRYKTREAALKKATSLAATLNNGTGTFGRIGSYQPNCMNLQDLQVPLTMRAKSESSCPLRNSDLSGRGSAEGETAEDQEIKMINEYPCRKRSDSALSDWESRIPDSGVPRDSDQLSCHSESEEPPASSALGTSFSADMVSSESLHNFKEEGGGEGLLPREVNVSELEDTMRDCIPLSENTSSVDGSLTSLLCPEEQLGGSYAWDYLLNWEPRFQPLSSVFTDIAMLPDEAEKARATGAELHSLMRPPPLITAVAQPGIRAVPPRMPPRMPILTRRPSYPKYAYSPLARNSGLTPSAMTPSFSPSLSLLTLRTPNVSPVVSETGLNGYTKMTQLPKDISGDVEIQL